MGLGLHGGALALVRWLLKHKAVLTITDLKTKKQLKDSLDKIAKWPGSEKIKYTLGFHDKKDFQDQDLIVQNPGVPSDSVFLQEAKKNNIAIVNEAVMFFGLYPGQSIGVTGTRGKSTTSTLIHKILKTEIKTNVVAGNIATNPMFKVLPKLKVKSLPVLELSSWHLERTNDYEVSPHIAVVTNVMNDHLNRYKNFSAYKKAKEAIVDWQVRNDFAVLNADNIHSLSFKNKTKAKVYFYSLNKKVKGVYLKDNNIYFYDGHKNHLVMNIDKIKLLGRHNLSNILAAVCVAKLVDISDKNITKAVNTFRGVPYRLEYKKHFQTIPVYNDSTSTTPDATAAAIEAMASKNILLIAGGEDKKMEYAELAKRIKQNVAYLCLLKGSASDKLLQELKKIKYPNSKYTANIESLQQAWQIATENLENKDKILFSPGGASFNMFVNEFDRARQFDKVINAISKKKK